MFKLTRIARNSYLQIRGIGSTNTNDIKIEPASEEYFQSILNHVTPIFLHTEPLASCFPPDATGKRERDFKEYADILLRSGFSVMALEGTQVVGACLSRVLTRDEVFNYILKPQLDQDDDPLNYNVMKMIKKLHKQLDLFSVFGVDKILELGLASVEPTHTGRGLGTRLLRASLELGACANLKAAKSDCTGPASTLASKKAGMMEVHKLFYDEYKVDNKVVFKRTPQRGTHLTVMACGLQDVAPYVLPVHLNSNL